MHDKLLKTARVTRLAKILRNTGIFAGTLLLLLGMMPVFRVFYYLLVFVIAACVITFWLFSWIILHPFDISFLQPMLNGGEYFTALQRYSLVAAPWLCAVAVIFCGVAIPLFITDKTTRPTGRIVSASIGIAMAVIGIIALYLGVKA